MHRDFHYFGTYLAARGAGFEHDWALKIGEYAELIDETWNSRKSSKIGGHKNYVADHDKSLYWKPEDFFGVKHRKGSIKSSLPKVQRTVTAVMSAKMMQKGGGRKPWFILSWSAFHFLPNLDRVGPSANTGTAPDYRQRYAFITEKTRLVGNAEILKKEQMLICYPDSKLARAMIDDTKKAVTGAGITLEKPTGAPNDIYQYINYTLSDKTILDTFIEYNGGFSPQEFIIALVGVRLHVFADLWAHQGFAAARSPRINDACRDSFHVRHSEGKWFREVDAKSHKKGFTTKDKILPSSHYGHGNAYTYPDLPSYQYRYVRPFDHRVIIRDNPIEFANAYSAMYDLLKDLKTTVFSTSGSTTANDHFTPDKFSQDFWRNHFIKSEENAHEKKPRNARLRSLASRDLDSTQKKQFIKDDDNADFGLIEFMHQRRKKNNESNLAYFSLAALCHLRWFGQVLRKSALGSNYPKWVNDNSGYKPDCAENFLQL